MIPACPTFSFAMLDVTTFTHTWHWRTIHADRKGQPCRVLARSRFNGRGKWSANSILVQFPDGLKIVTSRYAVRQAK